MASSLILGAMTGMALGLTGAGGGIIAIPLLTFGAGLTHPQAAPIALLATALAAGLGAGLGFRIGVVRDRAALLIGGVGMLVAPTGVWLSNRTPQSLLTVGLAMVMALSALTMYHRSLSAGVRRQSSTALSPCFWSVDSGRFVWSRLCAGVMVGIGLTTGALSGLLGVGGGFLLVPAFTRLTSLKVESIVSTSQAIIALVSAAGALAAATQHELEWHIALPFTLAAMAGLLVARRLARQVPGRIVQRSFALLSGGIALILIIDVARTGLTL